MFKLLALAAVSFFLGCLASQITGNSKHTSAGILIGMTLVAAQIGFILGKVSGKKEVESAIFMAIMEIGLGLYLNYSSIDEWFTN